MKNKTAILALIIALAALAIVALRPAGNAGDQPAKKETAFERVMRTRTIRCAYSDYPPPTIIDPNTKKLSGFVYDIIEEAGRRLSLKIDWVEEVGYGNINAGFETGRYDVFCSPVWPSAPRAASSLFTIPLYYSPVFVWVRPDDTRFDGDVAKLNAPQYTFVMIDGDVTQGVAEADFPSAAHLAAIQSANVSEEQENVITGKADAMAAELSSMQLLLSHNPGALKNATLGKPIRIFPNTILVAAGEFQMKSMLDIVINDMIVDGTIERTIKKSAGDNPPFYFVGKSYTVPEKP